MTLVRTRSLAIIQRKTLLERKRAGFLMIHELDHFRLDHRRMSRHAPDMDQGIERRTITAQLADRIAEAIHAGTWTGRIPGKRTLAKLHAVNPKTCAAALTLLEQRGLIGPGEAGRDRKILRPPSRKRNSIRSRRVLLLVHQADAALNLEDIQLFRRMSDIWSRVHGEVFWIGVDYPRYRRPGPVIDRLIKRYSASALMLHMSWPNWCREAIKRVPTYQAGGSSGFEIVASFGASSLAMDTLRVVKHLRDLGHRSILMPTLAWDESRRLRLSTYLSENWDEPPPVGTWEEHCPRFLEAVPEVMDGYWRKAFATVRPTAVILRDDSLLLSLYGYCSSNRLRIPKDVSVILLDHDKLLEYLRPRPTMLRYPVNDAAAHFQKWVDNDLHPIGRKHFELEWVEGESVAPLPRQ